MLNALNGAKQQCQSFLNDLNDDDQLVKKKYLKNHLLKVMTVNCCQ